MAGKFVDLDPTALCEFRAITQPLPRKRNIEEKKKTEEGNR